MLNGFPQAYRIQVSAARYTSNSVASKLMKKLNHLPEIVHVVSSRSRREDRPRGFSPSYAAFTDCTACSARIGCLPSFLLSLFPLRLDEHLKFFRSIYGSVVFSTELTPTAVHFNGMNVAQRFDGAHRCKYTGLEKQRFAVRLFLCASKAVLSSETLCDAASVLFQVAQYGGYQPHGAIEHLKCGQV